MTIRRYQSYKESGFRWIKEIPENWEIAPLAKLAEVIDPQPDHRAPAIAEGTHGHPYIGIRDINPDGTVNIETARSVEEEALIKQESSFTIDPGDITFCKVGTLGLPRIIRPSCRIALSATLVLVKAKRDQESVFLRYSLDAQSTYAQIGELATGSTRSALGIQQIRKFRIASPPRQDQRAIATFLDRETAKIDALIAEQHRLIELLQEKRQAVISHAVTKGLNPDAPMKDSGVEWLGEVPEHWEVKRMKHLWKSIEQGWSPQCENEPSKGEAPGILKVGCVNGGVFRPTENKKVPSDLAPIAQYSIKKGDLLVSRANTKELVGSAAVANEDFPWLYLCDKLYRITVNPDCSTANYLCLYLASREARGQIELGASGASPSMQNISQSVLLELPIPLPQQEEQENIQNAIAFHCQQANSLIAKAREAIRLFQERRSALISAAVTGQIDVRGLVTEAVGQ